VAIYVFDNAPLSCFARAMRLPELDRLTAGNERVTTRAVIDEIRNGVAAFPELQEVLDLAWLRVEAVDGLDELRLFAKYARRLGSDVHDIGEASVLAWAEANGAIAFTDDEAAVQAGRDEGVEVRRTLAVVARGIKHGVLSDVEADRLVDDLLRAGGRFPFSAGEFVRWARDNSLV
jgi:predicted nucleic acid-binding protein